MVGKGVLGMLYDVITQMVYYFERFTLGRAEKHKTREMITSIAGCWAQHLSCLPKKLVKLNMYGHGSHVINSQQRTLWRVKHSPTLNQRFTPRLAALPSIVEASSICRFIRLWLWFQILALHQQTLFNFWRFDQNCPDLFRRFFFFLKRPGQSWSNVCKCWGGIQ